MSPTKKRVAIAATAAAAALVALATLSHLTTRPTISTSNRGIPLSASNGMADGIPDPLTMSLDGYTPANILPRIADARRRGKHLLLNLTGGSHSNYVTNGVFSLAKWQAKLNGYAAPAIKAAVAGGVGDGTIVGASVMDEPQSNQPGKAWGPNGIPGGKATVDNLCGRVKAIFPTLPVGVVHDFSKLEPEKNYAVCDFLMSQYRLSKGSLDSYLQGSVAFSKRSHVALILSLNVLHGGTPSSRCTQYGDEAIGTKLCPMTPAQLVASGRKFAAPACALNMWRYEKPYFDRPEIKTAMRDLAVDLAKLPVQSCRRRA